MVARHPRQSGIIGAIPGAHALLRWRGWLGVALLVVPTVILAVFAAASPEGSERAAFAWPLAFVGLLALALAGAVMVRVLSNLRRMAEMARIVAEHNSSPIFVKDTDCHYRYANDGAAALLGRRPAEILGRRDSELDPGAAASAHEENDRVCLDRDLPTMFRESQQVADSERTVLVGKYPLHDMRGRVTGLVGMASDLTDEVTLQVLDRRRSDETRVWFDHNPLPVVAFTGSDLRILKINAAAARCYGYDHRQMLLMHLPDLFAPHESERLQAYLYRENRAIPPGGVAWTHRKASGELFDVLTDMGSLPHEDTPMHLMLVRDVSGEQTLRRALDAAQARYEDLFESGLEMAWTHDADGRLLKVNAAMARALGYEREDMLGHPLSEFVADEGRAGWDDYRERTRNLERDSGLLQFVSRDGARYMWRYRFVRYADAEPAPYVLAFARDVTGRSTESRVRGESPRDPLTGCRTRRFLDEFAAHAGADQPWGCIAIDIDYFRQLNASEGRARGDAVLRDLARLLASRAGSDAEVVRLGSDDFAIIMPRANAYSVRELAERLAVDSRNGMPVVFSLGWAAREAGEPLAATLRRADKMLLRTRGEQRP